jgi:hypothetical protein
MKSEKEDGSCIIWDNSEIKTALSECEGGSGGIHLLWDSWTVIFPTFIPILAFSILLLQMGEPGRWLTRRLSSILCHPIPSSYSLATPSQNAAARRFLGTDAVSAIDHAAEERTRPQGSCQA